MARDKNRAARAAELAAADDMARALAPAVRPQQIADLRELREHLHAEIAERRATARALSDQIRALEDLEEVNRAFVKIKARRGGGNVTLKSAPAKIGFVPKG